MVEGLFNQVYAYHLIVTLVSVLLQMMGAMLFLSSMVGLSLDLSYGQILCRLESNFFLSRNRFLFLWVDLSRFLERLARACVFLSASNLVLSTHMVIIIIVA